MLRGGLPTGLISLPPLEKESGENERAPDPRTGEREAVAYEC